LLTCITAIGRCFRLILSTFNAVVGRYFLLIRFTLSCSGFTFTCSGEFVLYLNILKENIKFVVLRER